MPWGPSYRKGRTGARRPEVYGRAKEVAGTAAGAFRPDP